MPTYSDTTDREILGDILKPMIHGEGWKVVLRLIGDQIGRHDHAAGNPSIELNQRLDQIGRREGLKELLAYIYKLVGEPCPTAQYPEMVAPLPRAEVPQMTDDPGVEYAKGVLRKFRGGSVA